MPTETLTIDVRAAALPGVPLDTVAWGVQGWLNRWLRPPQEIASPPQKPSPCAARPMALEARLTVDHADGAGWTTFPASEADLEAAAGVPAGQIALLPDPAGAKRSWLLTLQGAAPASLTWRQDPRGVHVRVALDPRLLGLNAFGVDLLGQVKLLRTTWAPESAVAINSTRPLRDIWREEPTFRRVCRNTAVHTLERDLHEHALRRMRSIPPSPQGERDIVWAITTLTTAYTEVRRHPDTQPYTYELIKDGLGAGRYALTGDASDVGGMLKLLLDERNKARV